MRIVVDLTLCAGHGVCEALAPELFEVGEDSGQVNLVGGENVAPSQQALCEQAVAACPMTALSLQPA